MALHDNPGMGPYTAPPTGVFDSAVEQLKQKTADFMTAYNVLMNDQARAYRNPTTRAKWDTLKNYADKTRASIEYIANAVGAVGSWFSDTFGFSGVTAVKAAGLGQVGFLPAIPVAVVSAALAAVVYIIAEIYKFHSLLNATPEQAQQVTDYGTSTADTGVIASVSSSVKWVALAALVIFGLPKLMEYMKK